MRKLSTVLAALVMFCMTLVAFAGPVNVNKASADEIAKALTGVGAVKAKAIVDYRTKHGEFKTVADLEKVNGIGKKTVEKNKDLIKLSDADVKKPATETPKAKKDTK